jgi:putative FmdB family regulatory protein
MPIYEYRCGACGHELEVLQKLSDEPLSVCPACEASALTKLVSAAGFQLKGSGWYVTDFKDSGKKKPEKGEKGEQSESGAKEAKGEKGDKGEKSDGKGDKKTETKSTDTASAGKKSGADSKASG